MSPVVQPLVVVDLMSHVQRFGPAVVAAHHRYTDPERPLVVVGVESGDATGRRPDWQAAFRDAAGIEVTGSTCMLGEDAPWASGLSDALEDAAREGTPVLGVCFGHQMLGVHFGASLRSWDASRVGIKETRYSAAGPLAAETLPILYTHRDRIEDAPAELQVAGVGGFGGIAAFAHRSLPVWGVQAHPEADAPLTRLTERIDVSAYSDAELDTPAAKGILRRFGRIAARHATAKTAHVQS